MSIFEHIAYEMISDLHDILGSKLDGHIRTIREKLQGRMEAGTMLKETDMGVTKKIDIPGMNRAIEILQEEVTDCESELRKPGLSLGRRNAVLDKQSVACALIFKLKQEIARCC
jgi:hypothetical protein